jgi:hypothetical protein
MFNWLEVRTVLATFMALAGMTLGCGSSKSPAGPSSYGLTVTSLSPNAGAPAGSTLVTIAGTGFEVGATVTLGGIVMTETIVRHAGEIVGRTPPHPDGVVDVVVINPGGQSRRLAGAFRYGAGGSPPPTVTAITPNAGSTSGGDLPVITGAGFRGGGYRPDLTVTFDGIAIAASYATDTTIFLDETPAHPAGPVDVVVTNVIGQTVIARGMYSYVVPQSLDFNGVWTGTEGYAPIRFTIQNNLLTSVSCGATTSTPSPPVPLHNGEFSYSNDDGVAVSGRIVSASFARGSVRMGPCAQQDWYAERQ